MEQVGNAGDHGVTTKDKDGVERGEEGRGGLASQVSGTKMGSPTVREPFVVT